MQHQCSAAPRCTRKGSPTRVATPLHVATQCNGKTRSCSAGARAGATASAFVCAAGLSSERCGAENASWKNDATCRPPGCDVAQRALPRGFVWFCLLQTRVLADDLRRRRTPRRSTAAAAPRRTRRRSAAPHVTTRWPHGNYAVATRQPRLLPSNGCGPQQRPIGLQQSHGCNTGRCSNRTVATPAVAHISVSISLYSARQ